MSGDAIPQWERGLYEAEVAPGASPGELRQAALWAAGDPVRRVLACPCGLLADLASALREAGPPSPVGVCALGEGAGLEDGGGRLRAEIEAMSAFDERHRDVGELWAYEACLEAHQPTPRLLEDLERFEGIEVFVRTEDLESLAAADCIQAAVDWPGTAKASALFVEAVTLDVGLRLRRLPGNVRPLRLLEALAGIERFDWATAEVREFLLAGAGATIDPTEGRSWLRAVQWEAARP
ncbi:MAG: hypothetical protein N2109_07915 [Fimbriimonadales bacterium]|nr:hypothetical protein [Fimbriimonadales bacterium]